MPQSMDIMHQEIAATLRTCQIQASSLLIYQDVLALEPGNYFLQLLQALTDLTDSENATKTKADMACLVAYGQWFKAMASSNSSSSGTHSLGNHSWQDYLIAQVLTTNNPFIQLAQTVDFGEIPHDLVTAVKHDLNVLQNLSYADGNSLHQWLQALVSLPFHPVAWQGQDDCQPQDLDPHVVSLSQKLKKSDRWSDVLPELAKYYRDYGTGLFAQYMALRWQAGELVGIAHPDLVQIDNLIGYELQKETLLKNTEFFLAGYQALHVLLYGSRGSGKSSLVKALLRQYGDRGLRLIEVAKSDLKDLPIITEQLRHAPQKFIIFVDDLSFEKESEDYKALKVLLEGNLASRPSNAIVYATSNRRHLLREYFSERPRPSDSEEVHPWDTVQEKLSLSDRFGLTLTFTGADQQTYLQIVAHLATKANLAIGDEDLEYRALQWATRHNGRSGRTAQQFIDFLQAELC
jgi:uncharacterized protein